MPEHFGMTAFAKDGSREASYTMSVDLSPLEHIFAEVIAGITTCRFGDEQYRGFHDCAKGVQWHVAEEPAVGACYLAVNLEGLKYGPSRPIHQLALRESKEPRIAACSRPGVRRLRLRPRRP
jgi:hypothetical protein